MADLISQDVNYSFEGTALRGLLVTAPDTRKAPAVVLIHDAFGLGEDMIANARALAQLGYAVFAADVWGERFTPAAEHEIGPLIGSMLADRRQWMGRIAAAHQCAAEQPQIDPDAIVMLGYCFGGSSALEYLRHGGQLAGAISIHGGLDLLQWDWSAGHTGASVLVATGAEDPMANDADRQRLQAELSAAGIDWQVHLYSGTKHAFTNPKSAHSPNKDVVDYNAQSAVRAWQATEAFLTEVLQRTPQAAA